MTYVITDGCVDVKDRSCVNECPVECIYEGCRSLYIPPMSALTVGRARRPVP